MPAYPLRIERIQQEEEQHELHKQLREELDACTEVKPAERNKAEKFLVKAGVWHIADINYQLRQAYAEFLTGEVAPISYSSYLKGFDRLKQHSLREQIRTLAGRNRQIRYQNQILFLPYHPDQKLAELFDHATKKEELVWDFARAAPEKLKRQVYLILHYVIRGYENAKTRRRLLNELHMFYDYMTEQGIADIDYLEQEQIDGYQRFLQASGLENVRISIVDVSRKALFLEAAETNWKANVWYLERFHFEPGRNNPSNPVERLSFLEVKHARNRWYLQQYMKYGLGITSLSINSLRLEFSYIRTFLAEFNNTGMEDVSLADASDMREYFRKLDRKEIQPETYNNYVMSILHFYGFLRSRRYVEKIPFHEQYYLKKVVPKHNDRSVEETVYLEVMQNLKCFPEELRLMFLHLWSIGLRASEVCTLQADAYYIQGRDAWIQIYQVKMKTYKRIPIPAALYKLMKVYISKYERKPDEYVFQNTHGGAYCYGTFRKKMLQYCDACGIQNGEYLFKSHDYRHTVATSFYDDGVSIQSVRDYLGHNHEEMTRQYIDYMPKKLAKANEEYFKRPENSLASGLKKRWTDGK